MIHSKYSFAFFIFGALMGFALVASIDAHAADVPDDFGTECIELIQSDLGALGLEVQVNNADLINLIMPSCVVRAEARTALAKVVVEIVLRGGSDLTAEVYKERVAEFGRASTGYGIVLGRIVQIADDYANAIDLTEEGFDDTDLGCITDSECEGLDADEERMFGNPYHPA